MNIVCLKHPKYQGDVAPALSCKACCGIFIAALRAKDGDVSLQQWIKNKVNETRGYKPIK